MDRASPRDAALLLGSTLCAGVVVVAAARAISIASRRRTVRERGAAKRVARDATRAAFTPPAVPCSVRDAVLSSTAAGLVARVRKGVLAPKDIVAVYCAAAAVADACAALARSGRFAYPHGISACSYELHHGGILRRGSRDCGSLGSGAGGRRAVVGRRLRVREGPVCAGVVRQRVRVRVRVYVGVCERARACVCACSCSCKPAFVWCFSLLCLFLF